jgi:hypothetical protein
MPDDVFHELPATIVLDLGEVSVLLGVLDEAAEIVDPALGRRIDDVRRSLTHKLWPELGQLLEDDDG